MELRVKLLAAPTTNSTTPHTIPNATTVFEITRRLVIFIDVRTKTSRETRPKVTPRRTPREIRK